MIATPQGTGFALSQSLIEQIEAYKTLDRIVNTFDSLIDWNDHPASEASFKYLCTIEESICRRFCDELIQYSKTK